MTKLIEENEATGKTKEVYDDIKSNFGMVPNLFKGQAAISPEWLESNWNRVKTILLADGALDRKTKELIALAVSLTNRCDYCSLAHESMAKMSGATEAELNETKMVTELFISLNSIADMLKVPCDISPQD